MKTVLSLAVILFSSYFIQAQESSANWKVIKRIKHNADFMTTDKLGNLYLANKNFIWLYNNKGDSLAAFNSRRYGEISTIDATDPYKILVFFNDYNLILFLDNYLSINGEPIDLQELGFDQISMVCQSRAKGIWVYDPIKQKAIHLDNNYKVTKETINLYQWFNKRISPTSMIEYNNTLFINEAASGLYVFDHFATYQKKIPIKGLVDFQVLDDGFSYLNEQSFCNYIFKDFSEKCKKLPQISAINMRMEKNKFYVFTPHEAIIYSTN